MLKANFIDNYRERKVTLDDIPCIIHWQNSSAILTTYEDDYVVVSLENGIVYKVDDISIFTLSSTRITLRNDYDS